MVELKGTEKQVKWASDIKRNLNSTLNDIEKIMLNNKEEYDFDDEDVKVIKDSIEELNNITDASYIIKNLKDLSGKDSDKVKDILILKKFLDTFTKEDSELFYSFSVLMSFADKLYYIENLI